ncbi:MAG: AMP-binding protein [Solirubrobacterales bacterium]
MRGFDGHTVNLRRSGRARWESLGLPYLIDRTGIDPDRPAVVFEDRTRTYGELGERAKRVAAGLVGIGVEPMDRVAVLSSNSIEYLEIELGISAARGIMVPLNWRLRAGELANLLRRSAAHTIFVEERFLGTVNELRRAGELPDLRTIVAMGDHSGDLGYEELCGSVEPRLPRRAARLEDPHEIIFTSGTTGEPKGVVWSDGTVLWNSIQQGMDFRLGPGHSSYAVIDLYYIGGRHDFTWPIIHQGGTVHVKRSSNFDAESVVRYVAEQGITHILWVPTMVYEILRLPNLAEYDLSRLEMIMCGGQPLSAAATERARAAFPGTDFIQVYGLTEAGGSVTFVPPEHIERKPGSAGRPAQHVELRIVDDADEEVPVGVDGEILVRAPSVTPGYWADEELTERLIVDGFIHTGDMGRLDEDGFLYIAGRKDDMIISGGMNIFPSEIEDVLRMHEDVSDAAVVGLPDPKWGELVAAVVEPKPGVVLDTQELVDFCYERLAGFKKPSSVHIVEAIPRTAGGKPKKFVLREQLTAREVRI